jgi:hypothetical protein
MPAKKKTKRKPKQSRADEIREELAKRGIAEKDVADAVKWARRTEGKGGILAWLRGSPLVGANLNLKRPRTKPRKIDL